MLFLSPCNIFPGNQGKIAKIAEITEKCSDILPNIMHLVGKNYRTISHVV